MIILVMLVVLVIASSKRCRDAIFKCVRSTDDNVAASEFKHLTALLKLMFVFISILSAAPVTFEVTFPEPFMSWLEWVSLAVLNFSFSTAFKCLAPSVANFHMNNVLTSGIPLLLGVLPLAAVYRWATRRAKSAQEDEQEARRQSMSEHGENGQSEAEIAIQISQDKAQKATRNKNRAAWLVLVVTYFFLPSAILAITGHFSCETFEDGKTLMRMDYSLSCLSTNWRLMKAYSVVLG